MGLNALPDLGPGFRLETETLTRRRLHRIYWQGRDPLEPSFARNNRYDCPVGTATGARFGVLYLGFDLDTCWMETVVRHNVVRPAGTDIPIPIQHMTDRWACEVTASEPLVLARFADAALVHLGECVSNIMGDGYLRTQAWAALLHAHAHPQVDGLLYRSRFMSDQFCVALFDRAIGMRGLGVRHARSINPATSAEAQAILRHYRVVPI